VVSKECTQSCSRKLSAAVSASKTQLPDTLPHKTPNLLMINDVGAPSPYPSFRQQWHKSALILFATDCSILRTFFQCIQVEGRY
jgi:hypothetical protein